LTNPTDRNRMRETASPTRPFHSRSARSAPSATAEWASGTLYGIDEMAVTFDELHQRLKDEREKLVRQLEQNRASAPAVGEMKEGSPYGKKEEGASEAMELEKRLALEKRLMGTLAEVEHALRKFEQGTYGSCDTCGQLVEMERLEVLPQAKLCLNCMAQQSKNAKGKFPGR